MVGFLMVNVDRPPLRLRRFRVLGLSFSTIVGMADLLLWFDSLDPALGKEPAVNLLDSLEAEKKILAAFLPITDTQVFEPFCAVAGRVTIFTAGIVAQVRGGRRD